MNTNVSSSLNAGSWFATARPAQASLKKTIQAYRGLSHRLKTKLDQLTQKREQLSDNAFVVVDDRKTAPAPSVEATPTPPRLPEDPEARELELSSPKIRPAPLPLERGWPGQGRFQEQDYHRNDLTSLAATVTNILIESVEIRLSFVTEAIAFLTSLYQENPKQRTPAQFTLARYEEWVQTNQRLFQLNSRLYDLEAVKLQLQRKQEEAELEEGGGAESAPGLQLRRSQSKGQFDQTG